MPIDAIYVSPRGRAQMTAAYTLERRGEQGTTLEWLAELHGGYAPGHVAWDLHPVELLRTGGSMTPGDWPEQRRVRGAPGGHSGAVLRGWDDFMAEQGYVRDGTAVSRGGEQRGHSGVLLPRGGDALTAGAHLLHIPPPLVYAHFGCDPSSVTILESDERDGWATFRLGGGQRHVACASICATVRASTRAMASSVGMALDA